MSDTLAGFTPMIPYVGGLITPRDYIPEFYAASWKGVAFHCEKSEDAFGRRGDIYEYPLGEETGFKDLGRKARRFKLEGYLIGGNQVDLTTQMIQAAESPEPGELVHPILGTLTVACISLKTKIEYRKSVRKSSLEFEFVEAAPSEAPYTAGPPINDLFNFGWAAIIAAVRRVIWATSREQEWNEEARIERTLAREIAPAIDEESFDAIDRLSRPPDPERSFVEVVDPIIEGTATIRRIHTDAAERLKEWNRALAASTVAGESPSIESLILVARLALARDLSLVVAQTSYRTVRDALVDLDFIVKVYDEEEAIAIGRCEDELTLAIRAARAAAVRTILNSNIRLPGIIESDLRGVWPSLVAAHIKFGDGRRYLDIEAYNPTQNPMFMGMRVISPAA